MKTVLFVCTSNVCRSPMAEAVWQARVCSAGRQADWEAQSAGVMASDGEAPLQQAVLAAGWHGLSIADHTARHLTTAMLREASLVLAINQTLKAAILSERPEFGEKVYTLREYAGMDEDITDPYGMDPGIYEACLVDLERCINAAWLRWQQEN